MTFLIFSKTVHSSGEEDAENNRPGPSNSENKLLRRKRAPNAPNTEIDKDKSQDNHFQSSDMNELRHPSTPLRVVNKTLDETIIINGDRPCDMNIFEGQ